MGRAERKKEGSKLADIINTNIAEGKIVPSEITVTLIKNAMTELRAEKGQLKFLIDGYPRSEGNVTSRILERAKTSGRNDDSIDVIRKRFETYRSESMPVIEKYGDKVRKIIADKSVEEVFKEVEKLSR